MLRPLPVVLTLLLTSAAVAQTSEPVPLDVLQERPDAAPPHVLLGPTFESTAAGISVRAPAGWKQIRRVGTDEIVQYVNDEKKWVLCAHRVSLSQPVTLSGGEGKAGMLEMTAEKLRQESPAAQVLRQEVVNLGQADAGIIVVRYGIGQHRTLLQEALIQADPQLYYVISLTTPAGKSEIDDPKTPQDETREDPQDRQAAELFRAVCDSVNILDRSALKEDQDERLYRTRALFVNLTEDRLRRALVPQQWLRLIQDGKDVGYSYVVEELAQALPDDKDEPMRGAPTGIRIGVRWRTMPGEKVQVDAESWQFMTFDRRHEAWSSVALVQKKPEGEGETGRESILEFGVSDRRVSRVLDEELPPGTVKDPRQPPVRSTETYHLTVTRTSRSADAPPVKRELPPFYAPQALAYILPRVLPLNEPKTYLLAVYVSEQQEVMLRYVDVLREQRVTLDGKEVLAVPVKDRIGAEGPVTFHYLSPRGEYLGSISEDTGITILPTNADTLRKIWADAELSRPGAIQQTK